MATSYYSHSNLSYFLVGIILGSVIGIYFTTNSVKEKSTIVNPFFLGVSITFPSVESKKNFLKDFAEFAKYVKEFEPTTLSYEVIH